MLTYIPPSERQPLKPTEKPWLLLLLAFVWLWPGIFGHDLWKPGEPYLYAAIDYMAQSGEVWSPSLHGQSAYVNNPPLYLWLGALSKSALSPWLLDGYAAVRLVTVAAMALGLACAGGAGRHLLGRRNGRSVVLILLGCIGLVPLGHRMDSLALTFAGMSMALYALSLARTRVAWAGCLLGVGWVTVFLSASLSELLALMLLAVVLLWFPFGQHRRYHLMLVAGFVLALPLCLVWPYALYRTDSTAFYFWWQYYAWGGLGGFARMQLWHEWGYYSQVILWYAWPAWPLALWTVYKRHSVPPQVWQVCGLCLAAMAALLGVMGEAYTDNAVLLLLPLALLGAAQLDSLRRGAAAFLNWFGIMTFGALAVFVWLGFLAMNLGWPTKLAERAAYFSPYYQVQWHGWAMAVAVLFTPLWLWAVTRKHVRGRQAVTNWAAGTTLVWSLMLTLFLPWLDAAKSYRPVVTQMQTALPESLRQQLATRQACISTEADNLALLTAWREYGWVPLQALAPGQYSDCDYRMVVRSRDHLGPDTGWQVLWQGARPREKQEIFALWQRQAAVEPRLPETAAAPE